MTLRLDRTEDKALWLEIQDGTSELPYLRNPELISEVGRGLMLVAYLSRSWGVRHLGDNAGKVVFAILHP
ncbi:hypothetical protein [Actinomadura pelletieri]|uniref:hypothetical protein n=1 Tax=Actinomadura pelletieri TaxID=111805 RepID=UPI000EAF3314|nr:hypothetical protein [Actinomadura pelletieri]